MVEVWLAPANPAAVDGMPAADIDASGQAKAANVLVIDDDASVRHLIVECLEILGYEVRQAADGEEGLALLRAQPPDLLMVDFIMPKLNGAEVIARARSLRRSAGHPGDRLCRRTGRRIRPGARTRAAETLQPWTSSPPW